MSYDIYLCDMVTGDTLHADSPHQMAGGTLCLGGTSELWLNVTYNYAPLFRRTIDAEKGIRALYGRSGAESLPVLDRAIAALGDDIGQDYWAATEGNAKRALVQLRAMALLRPNGVWDGD